MPILRNYYVRWFLWAFLFGAIVPPTLLFGWVFYEHHSTVRQLEAHGQPITIVTNPFVDITNPISGKVVTSGNVAFLIVAIFCGCGAGVLGLGLAGLKRALRQSSR